MVSMISIEERPAWGTRIINEEIKFEHEPCEVEEKDEHNLKDSISSLITQSNKLMIEDIEC